MLTFLTKLAGKGLNGLLLIKLTKKVKKKGAVHVIA